VWHTWDRVLGAWRHLRRGHSHVSFPGKNRFHNIRSSAILLHRKSILILTVLALGCARDANELELGEPADVSDEFGIPAGGARGTVRDALTDAPIAGAHVSAGDLGTLADDYGNFGVAPLLPGSLELVVNRRGFVQESLTVMIESGVSTLVDVPMLPAEPACCELNGSWSGAFVLDSAGLNASPSSRDVSGELVFDSPSAAATGEQVRHFAGRSHVDFRTLRGSDSDVLEDAQGLVFDGDSVAITVVPRFGDWGLEMLGRITADTIRGIWYQRASCCGAYGTFTLTRLADAD